MIDAVRQYGTAGTAADYNKPVKKSGSVDFAEVLSKTQEGPEKEERTTTLEDIFQKASDKYGVPVALLKAVAKQESNFKADAVSRSGAQGIMQLMPATARGLGVEDAFDPEENIMGGAKFLSQLMDKYNGNVKLALAAYNAGPGNVAKYGGIPPFKETQNYVVKVMGYLNDNVNAPGGEISRKEGTGSPTRTPIKPEYTEPASSIPYQRTEPAPEFTQEDYEEFLSLWKQQRQSYQMELNLYGMSRLFEKDEEDQRGTIFG